MQIEKIINNNIVSSFDEKGAELVVMGRGIGFRARSGQEIGETKIEKIFRMDTSSDTRHLQDLLAEIPLERVQLATKIIQECENKVSGTLSQNIYITLTDHINFALQRIEQGIQFQNPLLWETKRFYPKEFAAGKYAVEQINEHLGVDLPDDEAATIALHFVNAEMGVELTNTMHITKIIQSVFKIVRYQFHINLDEESLDYERFLTHLKFFAQRIVTDQHMKEDEVLHAMIRSQYKEAYNCAERIRDHIQKEFGLKVPEAELVYLAVHIERITNT